MATVKKAKTDGKEKSAKKVKVSATAEVVSKKIPSLEKEEKVQKIPQKEEDKDEENEVMTDDSSEDGRMSFELDDDIIPADDDEEDAIIETRKKEISRAGYEKLIEELKDLEENQIPSVNGRIKEAREFGDLSENAEYQSALNEKQMLETRIAELKEAIALSVVVGTNKNSETVQYGSTVTFEFVDGGEMASVTIIGSAEVSFEEEVKHVSFDSPIGLALEGKKVGDICKVRAEKGRFDLKIISIK